MMENPGRIETIQLESRDSTVRLLTLGCITQDWQIVHEGKPRRLLLGYADPEAYRTDAAYFGAIIGRVAGRISGARFHLHGREYRLPANEGPNTLHSGPEGLSRRIWRAERDGDSAVRFSYTSPDGEGGFPGAVAFTVTESLTGRTLCYDMTAIPDRPTPIALAQHNYYNLTGGPTIRNHTATIHAKSYVEVDGAMIPTGRVLPVRDTPYDFTVPRRLGRADPAGEGADVTLIAEADAGPLVTLTAPDAPTLRMWADQPALQLYTAAHMTAGAAPHPGQVHGPFAGVALEPQFVPDALNSDVFDAPIATPETPYRQTLTVSVE